LYFYPLCYFVVSTFYSALFFPVFMFLETPIRYTEHAFVAFVCLFDKMYMFLMHSSFVLQQRCISDEWGESGGISAWPQPDPDAALAWPLAWPGLTLSWALAWPGPGLAWPGLT
jgi:hypothetical protein